MLVLGGRSGEGLLVLVVVLGTILPLSELQKIGCQFVSTSTEQVQNYFLLVIFITTMLDPVLE